MGQKDSEISYLGLYDRDMAWKRGVKFYELITIEMHDTYRMTICAGKLSK